MDPFDDEGCKDAFDNVSVHLHKKTPSSTNSPASYTIKIIQATISNRFPEVTRQSSNPGGKGETDIKRIRCEDVREGRMNTYT